MDLPKEIEELNDLLRPRWVSGLWNLDHAERNGKSQTTKHTKSAKLEMLSLQSFVNFVFFVVIESSLPPGEPTLRYD